MKRAIKITNPMAVDTMLLTSVVHKASRSGVEVQISWRENSIDSSVDLFDYNVSPVHHGDSLLIESKISSDSPVITELVEAIEKENREIRIHNSDCHCEGQIILICLTYPMDSDKEMLNLLKMDPDFPACSFHLCYFDPARAMEAFADEILQDMIKAGSKSAKFGVSGWYERGSNLIQAHPMVYRALMQHKIEEQIDTCRPHIVMLHHGDAFQMANGIFDHAIILLAYRYIDVKFVMDTPEAHSELGLHPIANDLRSLARTVFPNSNW